MFDLIALLKSLQVLTDIVLITSLWGRHYYDTHFADEAEE